MALNLRAEAFGENAVLIWCDPADVLAIADAARRRWPEAHDVVIAAESVLVDGISDVPRAVSEIPEWNVAALPPQPGGLVELSTRYDGPDLAEVARVWSTDEAGVVALHTATDFVVAFCGFAPGFAYCRPISPLPPVPRRAHPRPRVEPGSVALADIYTGVYPTASPGGWQVIGRTEATLWDLGRDEPALLTPGTIVKFVSS